MRSVCSLLPAAAVGVLSLLCALAPAVARSQATGTVTGHVYLGDSQQPARFAQVELVHAEMPQAGGGGSPRTFFNTIGSARTALDGSFVLQGVEPGDYFVSANVPGYISAVNAARIDGGDIHAPGVHVQPSGAADVVVTLERGGTIAGRVQYDDGTPVGAVFVQARMPQVASTGAGQGFRVGGQSQPTDDRGSFRITGLPAGKYIVSTAVQTEGTQFVRGDGLRGIGASAGGGRERFAPSVSSVTEFAPGTMHQGEARVIDVGRASEITGVDIIVKLNGLHVVTGVAESKADSHPLNSGNATLTDTSDGSLSRRAIVQPDGTFVFEYIPAGSYALTVTGGDRQFDAGGRQTGFTRYTNASMTVSVGDSDTNVGAVLLDANGGSASGSTSNGGER